MEDQTSADPAAVATFLRGLIEQLRTDEASISAYSAWIISDSLDRDVLPVIERLAAERDETLRVLAPDLATGDRTLPQVAEAALAVARRGGKL